MIIIKLRLRSKILQLPLKEITFSHYRLSLPLAQTQCLQTPRHAKSSKFITVDFSLERPRQSVFVDNSY